MSSISRILVRAALAAVPQPVAAKASMASLPIGIAVEIEMVVEVE